MSAATEMSQVVTPAKVRRRVREQQLRGPVARPQQLLSPAGRPVQPLAPGAGAPVRLRQAPVARPQMAGRPRSAAPAGAQLTDRGLALVLGLVAALVLATVVVGVVKFFGVSNAPLQDGQPGTSTAMSATVG